MLLLVAWERKLLPWQSGTAVRTLLAALTVAGCELLPVGPDAPESPVECVGLPQPRCEEIVEEVGRGAVDPGVTILHIRIACTSAAGCTEASGELEYEAQLSNGRTVGGGQLYGAPVDPPGGARPVAPRVAPVCQGVPARWCRDLAMDLDAGPDPSAVVSIVIRCTGVCTLQKGEGQTVVTLEDGRRLESGWGYEVGPP